MALVATPRMRSATGRSAAILSGASQDVVDLVLVLERLQHEWPLHADDGDLDRHGLSLSRCQALLPGPRAGVQRPPVLPIDPSDCASRRAIYIVDCRSGGRIMHARVSRWGNSLAIRLPKAAVASLQVREGEPVDLVIEGDTPGDPGQATALHARGAGGRDAAGGRARGPRRRERSALGRRAAVSELPERGALVWVDLTPQSGHEQAGHRPALVISPLPLSPALEARGGLPDHLEPATLAVEGDAAGWPRGMRAPSWSISCARSIAPPAGCASPGVAPQTVVAEVQAKLAALFGIATDV